MRRRPKSAAQLRPWIAREVHAAAGGRRGAGVGDTRLVADVVEALLKANNVDEQEGYCTVKKEVRHPCGCCVVFYAAMICHMLHFFVVIILSSLLCTYLNVVPLCALAAHASILAPTSLLPRLGVCSVMPFPMTVLMTCPL